MSVIRKSKMPITGSDGKKIEYRKIYSSQQECCDEQDIPLHILQLAKKMKAPGMNESGRIAWEEFQPWYKEHAEELYDAANAHIGVWKTRKEAALAQLAEIELKQEQGNTLNKQEVIAFLRQISTAQMAMLKSKLIQELPSKLLGLGVTEMAVQMDIVVQEIAQLFQSPLDKWQ